MAIAFVLVVALMLPQRRFQSMVKLVEIDGLEKVVMCAGIHALRQRVAFMGGGHDDDGRRRPTLLNLAHQPDAPPARHAQIGDDHRRGSLFQKSDGLLGRAAD